MSLVTQINTVLTRVATEFKTVRTLIGGSGTADISALTTTDKSSLVAAINEVKSSGAVTGSALASAVHGATGKTTPVDADELFLVDSAASNGPKKLTIANLKNVVAGLIAGAAPAALDTLDELAAALGDDANYAATVTAALSNKQPLDTDLTAIAALTSAANKGLQATGTGTWALYDLTTAGKALLDDADAAAQRTTLSVYSTTEVGDPTTNFVTTFEAGLL